MTEQHSDAYWSDKNSGVSTAEKAKYVDDYFPDSAGGAAMPIDMPDDVPFTIESAEQISELSPDGVDVIPDKQGPTQNPPGADSGLIYPPAGPAGGAEYGYGKWGAPAPLIPSAENLREQAIVLAIADRLVSDQRPLLVQHKVAEHCHFESYPFNDAQVVGLTQIGTRQANGQGYYVIASGAGLYVGEDQNVANGNMGIPIPTAFFLWIPANCDLWANSAGLALSQATSIYVMTMSMGHTTLSGGEAGFS